MSRASSARLTPIRALGVWLLGAAVACGDRAGARSPEAAPPRPSAGLEASASGGGGSPGSVRDDRVASGSVLLVDAARSEGPPARPPDYEQADLDPENDGVVAPPEPLADCTERLTRAGIGFRPAQLPLQNVVSARAGREERVACGAEQVVTYLHGPARIRYNAPPLVTCRLALALARFEQLAVEEAQVQLGRRVVGFEHLGTYSCRKMVRFDFVSEHSYANAIDIQEITLDGGERLSVARHFGKLDAQVLGPKATFLRTLARRAFDERIFSNVLTPYWDALHRDHLHLDLARYRVDGTRPSP
jgi:hypothetical protein